MLNTKQSHSSITSVIFYTYSYNHEKNKLKFDTLLISKGTHIYFLEKIYLALE